MDIRGVLANRLREHRVDQADDGRIIIAFQQIRLLGQVLRQVRQIRCVIQPHLHGLAAAFVGPAQQIIEFLGLDTRQLQRQTQVTARLGQRLRLYR